MGVSGPSLLIESTDSMISTGFSLPNTDTDECTEDIDGCAHMCTNTVGSYLCSCDSGYRLSSNNRGCYGKF